MRESEMKTEEEIAKEKEAVQKMIGAKSAMETAINRIARLERELLIACQTMEEVAKATGDNLMYRTYQHGGSQSEALVVQISVNLRRISAAARALL